ncbi:MAG: diguanylate cyclase [Vulcanimicrobiota bacterium]
MTEAVKALGHTVVEAADGTFAWETFARTHFDVVISDFLMPEMNGRDLCRKVRLSPHSDYTYFIIVSARTKAEQILEGFKSGVDDYLPKPVSTTELECRLISAERVIAMHRELTQANSQLLQLSNKLRMESRRDALTGVGNRLLFEDDIRRYLDERRRYDREFFLGLCDIDNFKLFNDTYGHLEGDRILKAVAETLANKSRASDACYRFGGEEFLLVFPHQDSEGAEAVAERLRKAVEKLAIMHEKNPPYGKVTLSIGLSRLKATQSHQVDGCLKRADDALYRSKARGKNRITTAYTA